MTNTPPGAYGNLFMPSSSAPSLSDLLRNARLRLLRMHYEAKAGHIGGNLSCLDAMLALHHAILTTQDRFVLSKGHAAGALYVALWSTGLLTDADLTTFCQEGTSLPGHPSGKGIPNLLFPTGSLGHGPSLSAGLALALKHKQSTGKVYCLCSDGEWQEGSCWEALIFAVHQKLDNLVLLIDQNQWQGFGNTQEVAGITDLAPRFQCFGASVSCANGHDPDAIQHAVIQGQSNLPHVVILHTCKGRGLYFENTLASHYLPLTEEQYQEGIDVILHQERAQ